MADLRDDEQGSFSDRGENTDKADPPRGASDLSRDELEQVVSYLVNGIWKWDNRN